MDFQERWRNLFIDSEAHGLVISSSYGRVMPAGMRRVMPAGMRRVMPAGMRRVMPARKRRVRLPPPLFSPLLRSGEPGGPQFRN
jgi:hypothetical protein